MPTLRDIVDSEYVLLTTFRKTGQPVATPVWIAPDGDTALVTTDADSGKVKRLRHTPRITLAPCDARGRTAPDAPVVEATAEIARDEATLARLDRALAAKYGMKYRLIRAGRRIRPGTPSWVALVIR